MRAVIDKYAALPFAYGADCCTFVGECIEAVTGRNPAGVFKWSSEADARALIDEYGSLEATVSAVLGAPQADDYVPVDGDVTLHNMANGEQIVGIVYRGRSVVRTKAGLTDWPIDWAWRIWACRKLF